MILEYVVEDIHQEYRVICTHGWNGSQLYYLVEKGDIPIRTDTLVDCRRETVLKSTDNTRMMGIYRGICPDCGDKITVKAILHLGDKSHAIKGNPKSNTRSEFPQHGASI